jgi:hypothetical protein
MHRKLPTMVTAEEIDSVWGNANFGTMSREDVVKFGLLKCASGYYQGHTSKSILIALGLVTERYNVTRRGRYCLYEFFGKGSCI